MFRLEAKVAPWLPTPCITRICMGATVANATTPSTVT